MKCPAEKPAPEGPPGGQALAKGKADQHIPDGPDISRCASKYPDFGHCRSEMASLRGSRNIVDSDGLNQCGRSQPPRSGPYSHTVQRAASLLLTESESVGAHNFDMH
jgi:hypothetical protein